ncbi:MAG: DUF4230 domain-containing protein [Spirochaetales bacterium]|nr:DUF4230 domain-containing protein [Spirochaetales bacterium]
MPQKTKRRKKKKPPVHRALTLVLLAAVLGLLPAGAYCLVRSREEKTSLEIRGQIEKLGELTTITETYRSVFYTREKKNFIQDKSLLFTAEFTVQAGVDLSEGFELSYKGGMVRLDLPPGRIFLVDADDTSFNQIQIKEQFSSINTGDYLPLVSSEAEVIREQALDGGILRSAEERAALLLEGILRSAGAEEVSIRFREVPGI